MSENLFFNKKDLKYCGENVIIGKTVRIRKPQLTSIGDNSIIDDFTYISGQVHIGAYTHIASTCSIQASRSQIIIGDFCGLASGVKVFASSSDFIKCSLELPTIPEDHAIGGTSKKIIIHDFVIIGSNSVVLPGAILPQGFSCGAFSKITRDFQYEAWSVLIDQEKGTMTRRYNIKKVLKEASKLSGKKYSIQTC
jgi:acetyltransferase-like isoleucine patch superfamily enzyme